MAIIINAAFKPGSTMSGLSRMQAALDRINKTIGQINAGLQQMAQNGGVAAQAIRAPRSSSGGRSRSGGGSSGRSARLPTFNPFANNPQAGMQYFARGAAAGNPYAARMYGRYAGQAASTQRNQVRAQTFLNAGGSGNPLAGLISNVMASTRFGKGGAQVLGHHAASLLNGGGGSVLSAMMGGGGAAAGGAGLAALAELANPVGLAVAAIGAMAAVVGLANDSLAKFSASLVSGGGSASQAMAASRLGDATGTNVAGVGKGLSGYAAATLGVSPLTGPFGAMDYNARGLKAMDSVRNSKSLDAARRKAELYGDPGLANAYLLSKDNYNLMRNPNTSGTFKGDERVKPNLDAGLSNAMAVVQQIASAFSSPILQAVGESFTQFAKNMQGLDLSSLRIAGKVIASVINAVADVLGVVEKVMVAISKAIAYILDKIPKAVKMVLGWDDQRSDNQAKAIDDNTKAVQDNTQAQREGTFGGGGRAVGSTPSGLNPRMPGSGYQNVVWGVP